MGSDHWQAHGRTPSGWDGSNAVEPTASYIEVAMNQNHQDRPEHDMPSEESPDITMTDSGEKEPGEDPDFDDSEIDGDEGRG